MLTEILLAVTTQEMEVVAKEVFYKEKNRAAKGSTRLKARVVFEAGGPPHSLVVVNHDRIIGAWIIRIIKFRILTNMCQSRVKKNIQT